MLAADEDLARIVSLLLKHAGFEVVRADDRQGIWSGERRRERRRLVVVQGVTDATGAHPLGGFVPPADRGYRVVALVSGGAPVSENSVADHVVEAYRSTPGPSPPTSSASPTRKLKRRRHFTAGHLPQSATPTNGCPGPGSSIRATRESDPSFR